MNIDNLSEQQFLRAVEEGEDLQEVMKRVQARREQRVAMGLPMYSDDEMDEDDYGQEQYEVSVKKQASIKRQLEQQAAMNAQTDLMKLAGQEGDDDIIKDDEDQNLQKRQKT